MAGSDTVRSVERAMTLLEAVADAAEGRTLAQLADALGVRQTTAYNLARTLAKRGYLSREGRGARYRLGPACGQLAAGRGRAQRQETIAEAMRALAARLTGWQVALAEAVGLEIRIQYRAYAGRSGEVERGANRPTSPYVQATNLCYLAFWDEEALEAYLRFFPFDLYGRGLWQSEERFRRELERARKRGRVELGPLRGRSRLAAPVYDGNGALTATIGCANAGGKEGSVSPGEIEEVRESLLKAARELSFRLPSDPADSAWSRDWPEAIA